MYYPTLAQVKARAREGNLAPVYRSIHADLETPVSAYLKVARGPYSYLLESVEGGERLGRYSFIGTNPYKVITSGPNEPAGEIDPLIPVEEEMSKTQAHPGGRPLPGFHGGAVGYIAYDAIRYFEARGCRPLRLTPRACRSRCSCSATPSSSSTTCATTSRSSPTPASTAT